MEITRSMARPLLRTAAGFVAPMTADAAPALRYDLVIRGGRVIDGGGNPWVLADVAIDKGRFAKIGRVEGRGRREIDARDLIRQGLWADVTMFDLDRLEDRAGYADPTAYPVGTEYVIVNKGVVAEHGKHTGALPGRIPRGDGK